MVLPENHNPQRTNEACECERDRDNEQLDVLPSDPAQKYGG